MIRQSHSQSGQDRFVDLILHGKRDGRFLDIGCNHPIELSNTYAFETELGWKGLLIDRDEYCVGLCKLARASQCVKEDVLAADWSELLNIPDFKWGGHGPIPVIDYLSIDCDENTLAAIRRLLDNVAVRFRVLTVETDAYRFGPGPRDAIDGLLQRHGYDLLCRNVRSSDGSIYETWAVDPKLVDMKIAEKFRSDGLKWNEILALE